MASSSSSHKRNRESNAFSEMEPGGKTAKVFESSRLFDVFINHRGPDVKETLATELYNSLRQLRIEAFLDSQEKELGKSFPSTIEIAIRSAQVHIAIFSPRYAESPWCLAELLLMIESKVKIIPVFYEVKPWELRHIEKGVYRGAFIDYEEKGRYLQKLSEWKEALQTLSFIAGVEFQSFSDYKTIIAAVEKEVLQSRQCLHVAKYPVGLNNLVEDFERRCLDELVQDLENQCGLAEKKNRPSVVGIFGMGGVGKTTLAKELFNRKRSEYSRASFLFDVREASARGELRRLQSELVKDLFDREKSFTSIEKGKSYLKDNLQRFPLNFLIVVDDIDHVEQLEALLIMDTLNKSGNSLIIVTTRDVGVLISTGITIGYPLKGMGRNNGRQLFCWHAFDHSIPSAGYEALVEQFVDVCGGLPLSLLVLGRLVHGRDLKFWESNVLKARRTLPRDVKQRLRISFDALEDEEKQVFMDMACFFLGKPKRIAELILEGSGWGVQTALQTLKDKCLIEDMGYSYRMHDHLRDLGREMAHELSPSHRLWRPQDLQSMELMGLQNIVAKTNNRCFHSFDDNSMGYRVRFFLGQSDSFFESSASLLWLELKWHEYMTQRPSLPSLPAWIPLHHLQRLEISGGSFKTLWENHTENAPRKLYMIGKAADGAESSLNESLFSSTHIGANALTEIVTRSSGDLDFIKWCKKSARRKLYMSGKAVDGSVSSLDESLFSDAQTEIVTHSNSHMDINEWCQNRAAVIMCLVVVADSSTSAEDINKFLQFCDQCKSLQFYDDSYTDTWPKMLEGEWIITMVAEDNWRHAVDFQNVADAISRNRVLKKGFLLEVEKGEESKCLSVLRIIVDRLHQ